MTSTNILLILISGLGVIHGLFLAVFLWTYPKGNQISNKILSLLLVVLSFRIGKSVLLEFAENLDVKLIFVGLGMMMAIGPLFYLYTRSSTDKSFLISRKQLLHFLPALAGVCLGLWVNDPWLKDQPKALFMIMFGLYYGHYLIYLIISYKTIYFAQKEGLHRDTYALLRLLFYALISIWVVYVLNLFDEFIPYILGPILYSLIAYIVSFIVIKNRYIETSEGVKYKTTPISNEQTEYLFAQVVKLMQDEKLFRDTEITLRSLSKKLNTSTQILSLVVNKKSQLNFNSFINQYRIEESILIFQNTKYDNRTIASIAFDVGFNSISSFNTAFKKHTEKTPLAYRKTLISQKEN